MPTICIVFSLFHFDSHNIENEEFYYFYIIKYYFDAVKIFKNASCGIDTLPTYTLFPFFLFVQKFALPCYISSIALCSDIFT